MSTQESKSSSSQKGGSSSFGQEKVPLRRVDEEIEKILEELYRTQEEIEKLIEMGEEISVRFVSVERGKMWKSGKEEKEYRREVEKKLDEVRKKLKNDVVSKIETIEKHQEEALEMLKKSNYNAHDEEYQLRRQILDDKGPSNPCHITRAISAIKREDTLTKKKIERVERKLESGKNPAKAAKDYTTFAEKVGKSESKILLETQIKDIEDKLRHGDNKGLMSRLGF